VIRVLAYLSTAVGLFFTWSFLRLHRPRWALAFFVLSGVVFSATPAAHLLTGV
jgi:hypothetical protein